VLARLADTDTIFCLGDTVGYGPNPNECLELIRKHARATVLGNHDLAALDNFGIEYFNDLAREALIWTQRQLSKENRRWLDTLGYEIRASEYLLVHGAPVQYFRYIMDKSDAADAFSSTDAPLIFVGHTHVAEAYILHDNGEIDHHHYQHGGVLRLDAGLRYLLNVGSVGQPRDLNAEASFAFYDDQHRTITWERVAYDIESVRRKILTAELPEALGTRLIQGR
jgi:diadenosine tetraphosphatase ApaH/serine/threonine PP2A family protein phosphatase